MQRRHPLTAPQRAIWADEKFSPGEVLHTMGDHLDVRGPLDVRILADAVGRLVGEAEVLRGRVVEDDGVPFLQVGEPERPEVVVRDLGGHGADAHGVALAAMHDALQESFDLDHGPLFRITIFRLGPERHLCFLAMHHVLCDGFSRVPLYERLGVLYRALRAGVPVPGPGLPPYSVLLDAVAAYETGPDRERDRTYWESVAARIGEPLTLSDDPVVPGGAHQRVSVDLPAGRGAPVRAAAAALGCSWATFVVAAVGAYLGRAAGRARAVLTLPVAARVGRDTRRVPGTVANYLPFVVPAEPARTVRGLVAHVARDLLATLRHQRFRGEDVRRVAGLSPRDRRPFGPYVNVLPQSPEIDLGDASAVLVNMSTGIVDDLMVTVLDGPGGSVEIHVDGNPRMYSTGELRSYARGVARFLEALAGAGPDALLAEIPLVADPEARETLARVSTGPEREADVADVVERVRHVAAASPEATAVVDDVGRLRYDELVEGADAVSRRLRAGGGRPAVVAVLAEPGTTFVTSVLGVLGAGAAFVPLDVRAPAARVSALLADCGADVVLVDAAGEPLLDALDEPTTPAVVRVDRIVEEPGTRRGGPLAPVLGGPGDVAYVLYTSGTTGRPKGAMVHRAGLLNHLAAKQDVLALGAGDTLVQNAPVTFDVSIWQMLSPLLVGGTVRVVGPATAADPDALAAVVGDEEVTVLEVVPSLLRAALDLWGGHRRELERLRFLLVTGEALPVDLARRWSRAFPDVPLVNAYGPTECSDDVAHAVVGLLPEGVRRAPVGEPVRNTTLHVLGPDLALLPRGSVGELYVAGAAVGKGYLDDPGRTAATFVADPFGGTGARMYRTGDRVRWSADGLLEFVERLDHQVKIRGQRIELGEIESVLRSVDGVDDAVVVARRDVDRGLVRLEAYVTGRSAGDLDVVRARVAELVPEHLRPARWGALDALPLTAHGKVDRSALVPLPAPGASASRAMSATRPSPVAPARDAADAVETVRRVFADLLGVRDLGPDDGFFEVGGDSISAIQAVAALRREGIEVTPRDVFDLGTARALGTAAGTTGRLVGEAPAHPTTSDAGAVEPTPAAVDLALSAGSITGTAARYAQYTVLRVPAAIEETDVVRLLDAAVRAHPSLRLRVADVGPGVWDHAVDEHGTVATPGCVRSAAPGADLSAEVGAAAARLSPVEGVVWQAVLLTGEPRRLLLVIHHLAVDGVSWRVLREDLARAWDRLATGAETLVEPEPATFADHAAVWGRAVRTGGLAAAEAALWRDVRSGRRSPPLDPDVHVSATSGRLTLELDRATSETLLGRCPADYRVDVNDLLLGALAVSLADAGLPGSVVEVEGHGREEAPGAERLLDLSRTIGWFTSAFPVALPHLTDRGDRTTRLRGAVKAVHQLLRSVPRHGIGHGALRHLHPQGERLVGARNVPPIGFNYLGRTAVAADGAAWELESLADAGARTGARVGTIGTTTDPRAPLRHGLALTALAEDRADGTRLVVEWTWASGVHDGAMVQDVAEAWFRALRELVAARADVENTVPVPVDVAADTVTAADLERFAGQPPATTLLDVLPLNAVQRGILFESHVEGGPDPYVLQIGADLVGEVDVARLREAFDECVAAHPVLGGQLRYTAGGAPVHVLRATGPAELVVDAPGRPAPSPREERERRFDLSTGPMVRARLTPLEPRRHRFTLTVHHVVVDGWSMPLLVAELLRRYEHGSTVPPLTYRRIAPAPHDDPRGVRAWRAALAGLAGPTLVGAVAPDAAPEPPCTVHRTLDSASTSALTAWARENGVTLASALLVAWGAMLAEETGAPDVVFGAVVSTRRPDVAGSDAAVGMFLGNVPVRVRRFVGEDAAAVVRRVQLEQAALREHGHVGRAAALEGHPTLGGLGAPYDTAVMVENFPGGEELEGRTVAGMRIECTWMHDARPFPLGLVVHPGDELALGVDHRPPLVTSERAERCADRFVRALTDLAEGRVPTALAPAPRSDGAVRTSAPPTGGAPAARTPRPGPEADVCAAFETVLEQDGVGPDDNFLVLGGDSIAAIHLVTELRSRGYRLTAQDVLLHRTPAALAPRLTPAGAAGDDVHAPVGALPTYTDAELAELDAELGF